MVAAVVLAAGRSERFGRPKPLVRLEGRTLVRRVTDAAREGGCDPVIVVLGANAGLVLPELEDVPVRVVVNDGWQEGLASSIRAGVAAAGEKEPVAAVLLLTCDQPKLDAAAVRRILERFDGDPRGIVASHYCGTVGVPALFGRGRFTDLAGLSGDRGAKGYLLGRGDEVARVDWPDGATDIDTPEDFDALL